jgi:hypothetical protein
VQGPRKIISASGAVVQEHVAGDSFWLQKLLVAITAWSFHTVCLNYATGGTHFWANPGTAKLLILPYLAASKMAHSGYMPGYLSHKTIVFDSSSAGSIPPLER